MQLRGTVSLLCLLAAVAACDGPGIGSCPARDGNVSLSFSLSPGTGEDESPPFDGECAVVSAAANTVVFDCAGAPQTLTFDATPAPDLGAFTPGLAVRVERHEQSPPDLMSVRVTAGGEVLLFARTGHGSLHSDDWSPLQFSDESFCRPRESDDCGYTFARYKFSAAVDGGTPAPLHDGSAADLGTFQVWVAKAVEVEKEDNKCADAYPGRYTMAILRKP